MDKLGRPRDFAFVAVDGLGKPKQVKDKRVIRRHVMRGRNLKIGIRPVPDFDIDPSRAGEKKDHKFIRSGRGNHDRKSSREGTTSDEEIGHGPLSSLATQSCVSPFRFYHNLNACAEGLTFDFYTGSSAAICGPGMGIDFDLSNRLWYQWLVKDATYTHPLLFCISASYSILQRRPLEKTALYHLDKTITFLNRRLSDPVLALRDSTTCMVATLVLAFSSLGEHATARVHMNGLLQMARLRGGLGAFRHCAILYSKIARFDLAYSLESGDEPVFTHDHLADLELFKLQFHHILYYSEANIPSSLSILLGGHPNADNTPSPNAQKHWHIDQVIILLGNLQNLTNKLNIDPSLTRSQLSTIEFRNAIYLLQYQLQALRGKFTDTDNTWLLEAFCLAMLAFLATAAQTDLEGPMSVAGHHHFSYLGKTLRRACSAVLSPVPSPSSPTAAIEDRGRSHPRDLVLWILIVSAMSTFQSGALNPCPDDASWMWPFWHSEIGESTMTWDALRVRMKSIAWIDDVHDPLGKLVFEAMSSWEDSRRNR